MVAPFHLNGGLAKNSGKCKYVIVIFRPCPQTDPRQHSALLIFHPDMAVSIGYSRQSRPIGYFRTLFFFLYPHAELGIREQFEFRIVEEKISILEVCWIQLAWTPGRNL